MNTTSSSTITIQKQMHTFKTKRETHFETEQQTNVPKQ